MLSQLNEIRQFINGQRPESPIHSIQAATTGVHQRFNQQAIQYHYSYNILVVLTSTFDQFNLTLTMLTQMPLRQLPVFNSKQITGVLQRFNQQTIHTLQYIQFNSI
jgi:hypothetical protein